MDRSEKSVFFMYTYIKVLCLFCQYMQIKTNNV